MPRKPKPETPGAEVLAPIRADILDQIVRDGPLTAEEIETASRRFKQSRSRCRAIARGRSSRSSLAITSGASPGSTTRSLRYTRAA